MKKTKLTMGIIGTGIAAHELHLPAFLKLQDGVELRACTNRTFKKAQSFVKFAKNEGLKQDIVVEKSVKALLERKDIDAVLIAVPIEKNLAISKLAAQYGKHILVEKPLSHNLTAAKKLLDLEMAYPELLLMLAENFRYRKNLAQAQALIREGKIGKVYAAHWESSMCMDDSQKWTKTTWRIDHKYAGGFVTDGGIHAIALIRELCGELNLIGATKSQINPKIGEMDTFHALYKSSESISVQISMCYTAKDYDTFGLVLLGDKGTIKLSWDKVELLTLGKSTIFPTEDGGGYENQLKIFADAALKIENDGVHPKHSSLLQGYKDLEAMLSGIKKAKFI